MAWYDFMKDAQYLAQVGHFLGGAWVVFLCGLFGGETAMWVGLGVWIVATSLKEFWFDIVKERDGWPNSIMDWIFWQLGEAAGIGVFFLATHLHRLI